MSESTANLSLVEWWTITEIQQQLNYVLTYSVLAYVFLQVLFTHRLYNIIVQKMTRMNERELIKPLNF